MRFRPGGFQDQELCYPNDRHIAVIRQQQVQSPLDTPTPTACRPQVSGDEAAGRMIESCWDGVTVAKPERCRYARSEASWPIGPSQGIVFPEKVLRRPFTWVEYIDTVKGMRALRR